MSWNKRRSWNNAGHCHPLVMLFSSNILIHPKSTKNLRFLRHERICAIPDRFTLTMGMQRCMLGESKLHVHRDPEKGVCLRASVAVTAGDVLFREMPLLSASTAFAKSFLFCSGLHPVPTLELRVPSMFKAQFWRDTWMKVDFWYINNDAQLQYVREICGVQLLCDDSKKSIVSVGAVLGLFLLLPFLEPLWMEATSNWEVAEEHRCFLQDHPSRRSLVDLAVAPMDSSLMCFCRLINVRATWGLCEWTTPLRDFFPLFTLRLENFELLWTSVISSEIRIKPVRCPCQMPHQSFEKQFLSLQSDFAVPDSRIAKMALRPGENLPPLRTRPVLVKQVYLDKLLDDTCQIFSEDVRIDPLVGTVLHIIWEAGDYVLVSIVFFLFKFFLF